MKNLIGKEYIVKDLKHNKTMVGARYIDNGRRVRITSGEYAGEVLSYGEFEAFEEVEQGQAPCVLAMVWAACL